jgi:hypothetical protein
MNHAGYTGLDLPAGSVLRCGFAWRRGLIPNLVDTSSLVGYASFS